MPPIGISEREITKILAQLEAEGEINNVPPAQLAPIIAKARQALRGGP